MKVDQKFLFLFPKPKPKRYVTFDEEEESELLNKVNFCLDIPNNNNNKAYKYEDFLEDWDSYNEGDMCKHDVYCNFGNALLLNQHRDQLVDETNKVLTNDEEHKNKLLKSEKRRREEVLVWWKLCEDGKIHKHDLYCEMINLVSWGGGDKTNKVLINDEEKKKMELNRKSSAQDSKFLKLAKKKDAEAMHDVDEYVLV